jgi:hypothetical protein
MFAATDHPFHIQTVAFFTALLPIIALFVLLAAATLSQRYRRSSRAASAQRPRGVRTPRTARSLDA